VYRRGSELVMHELAVRRRAVRRSLSVRALREYCEVLALREAVARHAHAAITRIQEKQLVEIRKKKNNIELPPCGNKENERGRDST